MTYRILTRYQVTDPGPIIQRAPEVREKVLAVGARRSVLFQPLATGPSVGALAWASAWDSIDAAIEGLAKVYADPAIAALRDANPVLSRSISKSVLERGDPTGSKFVGITRFTASTHSERGVEICWEKGQPNGITAIRVSQYIAGGETPGSYVALFFVVSLDGWAETVAQVTSDKAFLEEGERTNFSVTSRGLAKIIR